MKKKIVLSLIGLLIGQFACGMDLDPSLPTKRKKRKISCHTESPSKRKKVNVEENLLQNQNQQEDKKERQLSHTQCNTFFNSTFVPPEVQGHIAHFMLDNVISDIKEERKKQRLQLLPILAKKFLSEVYHTNIGDYANSFKYNNNNTYAIAGCESGAVKIWSVDTGECIYTLRHESPVLIAMFNHDSTRVIAGCEDGTAKVWNMKTGECIYTLRHVSALLPWHWNIDVATFNHDSTRVATGSRDCTVKIWDMKTGRCICTLQHDDWIARIKFNHNSTLIMTKCMWRGTIKIWDINRAECINEFEHDDESMWAQFSFNNTGAIACPEKDAIKKLNPSKIQKLMYSLRNNLLSTLSLEQAAIIYHLIQSNKENKLSVEDLKALSLLKEDIGRKLTCDLKIIEKKVVKKRFCNCLIL